MIQDEEDLSLVGSVTSGEALLDSSLLKRTDVLLLDINLPGKSGIEICEIIKERFPGVRVLGLSTYDKGSVIRKMMKSGATGFVLKNAGSEELLRAIRAVATGETYLGALANQALVAELTGASSTKSDYIPDLTRREKQVLALIAKEFTTPEIADELIISVNTAETYRKNLLHKFNVKNAAGLVRKAMERGML
jgi:DNA-binding NarL/FixJ family response regulator